MQIKHLTLNLQGRLFALDEPQVMGIINVTPDSFYAGSRIAGEAALRERVETLLREGATIADLGAYSSRPGADVVPLDQEKARLEPALRLLRDEYPTLPVSVDTFRAEVARWAVEEYGAAIINDISGGELDPEMFRTVSELRVPYILMHMRGTPETMQQLTQYDSLTTDIADYFIHRIGELLDLGAQDIILDPGFGFSKTLEQNYQLLAEMDRLDRLFEWPLLVGVSRKSMVYRPLGTDAQHALNGTTILHAWALERGAKILRVHDVAPAVEAVRLYRELAPWLPTETEAMHYHSERKL